MKKRIFCTALAGLFAFSSAASASAAEADTNVSGEGAKGTFFFDSGEWQSESVQFIIYDDTAELYATRNGWTEEAPWTSKAAKGTKLDNGLFETFEFEYPEGHELSFIAVDFEKGQTYYCDITPDVFGDIARIIPEVRYEGDMSVRRYSGALKFDRSGISVIREQPFYDTAEGSIWFDASEWGSKNIDFFIYDVTGDKTMYATKDGWVEENPWGKKSIRGTDYGNGRFGSFGFDLIDSHEVYVIFSDPDNGHQTYPCVLTVNSISSEMATLTDKIEAPSDGPQLRHAEFKFAGESTSLSITPTGDLSGRTVHPNADHEAEIASFILNRLGTEAVTPEKVANAIAAFKTTPELVWWKYKTLSASENYNEAGARAVLFPSESSDDAASDPDTDKIESKPSSQTPSETVSETSTSSSNGSKVTSPKTGDRSAEALFPVFLVLLVCTAFAAAAGTAVMIAKHDKEE